MFLLLGQFLHAQITINGVVKSVSGTPLSGASVVAKGGTGNVADDNGSFSLTVPLLPVTLTVSHVGYVSKTVNVANAGYIEILLAETSALTEITVVGSRFVPRSVNTSPVPIDNIRAAELRATGQPTVADMLTYAVPSYNSQQQTISDATAHFDPADLRGLGPSRTLVLVNGKRKNPSSLVYINDTYGKGEVGVDMKSIPVAAIERIEVLRDGASAEYGSDAIAGVVNIILKSGNQPLEANLFSGITSEGDGFRYGYDVSTGFKVGNGYVNVSQSFSKQKETNRANKPGKDDLFGVPANDPTWGTWLKNHPDLGMHIGMPNMLTGDVFYNASIPVSDNVQVYSFGGITYRKGISYALYRAPYWIPDPYFLLHGRGTDYNGFQPTFETDINDNTFGAGVKGELNNWQFDVSATLGHNDVDYTVGNTLNVALGATSPTTFKVGGYEFNNQVFNLDLSRKLSNVFNLSLGTEFRTETFVAKAGQPESYEGNGAQSFPGLQPSNEVNATRYNIGTYADLNADITENLLLGGAVRFENYSDFGDNISWKVNARYLLWNQKITLRSSYSTGFRAPSLHQIYLSNIQTLVSGGSVSNQGTFNNQSSVIRQLEVPKLTDEKAKNFTAGIAIRPSRRLNFTLDYYNVRVNDRILFSSSVSTSDTTTLLGKILKANQITSLKFFTNAVNTQTNGVDFVATYNSLNIGAKGRLGINVAANYAKHKIVGNIKTPAPIAAAGLNIFDRKEQSRILTARPNEKVLLGLSYTLGKANIILNNTHFGEVTWQHESDPKKDQTFSAKVITDLLVNFKASDKIMIGLNVNNLLNVYPDVLDTKGDVVTDLGGRFKYPWEVNQFGFMGTIFSLNVNFKF